MRIAPIADVKAKRSEYVEARHKGTILIAKNGRPTAAPVCIESGEFEMIIIANSPRLQEVLDRSARSLTTGKGIVLDEFRASLEARPTSSKSKKSCA